MHLIHANGPVVWPSCLTAHVKTSARDTTADMLVEIGSMKLKLCSDLRQSAGVWPNVAG